MTLALHEFIDRLSLEDKIDVKQPIDLLISGLNEILDRPPYVERGVCHVSEKFTWLLGSATQAVERRVSNRLGSAMNPDSIAIMLEAPVARYWKGEDIGGYRDKLNELAPSWPELNDKLFWFNVGRVRAARLEKIRESLAENWPFQWPDHYWAFTREDRLDAVEEDIIHHFLNCGCQGKGLVVSIDELTTLRMLENVLAEWKSCLWRFTMQSES